MSREFRRIRATIPNTKDEDKQALLKQLEAQKKAFKARGGKIQKCAPGETQETSLTRKHYGMGAGLTKGELKKKGLKGARRT